MEVRCKAAGCDFQVVLRLLSWHVYQLYPEYIVLLLALFFGCSAL